MKPPARLLTLLVLLVPLLAGCGGRARDELTICSSLPLNGGANERAVAMRDAIQLAVEEQGSVTMGGQSYRLRHVPMDDTVPETGSWDTEQERRNARAAIEQHDCIGYVGTYNSGAAKIAIPILNRVEMVMISPGNTYPGLTKPGGGLGDEPWIYSPLGPERRNFCRVVPADDLQAPAAARYAQSEYGAQYVAIFHDTELYGRGLADLFASAAEELDMAVIAPPFGISAARVNGSDAAYIRQIRDQLLAGEPDLIYFGGNASSGAGIILRELRAAGFEGLFMGGDAMAEDLMIEEAGAFGGDDRLLATLVSLPADQLEGRGADFYATFRQRFGEPDPFAAPSYEATRVLIDAIERATIPDGPGETLMDRARPAVLAAVRETRDYDGVMGRWSFDENCDTTLTTITINGATPQGFVFVDVIE